MSSSIFSRLFGKNDKSQAGAACQKVDISRVIPDFAPHNNKSESPASLKEAPARDASMDLAKTKTGHHPEDKAEAAIEALKAKHDKWAQSDLSKLAEAWAKARKHEDMSGHLAELGRVTHNLKGMASTYGYPSISRLATSLERLLKSENLGQQHALINLHVEACRAAYIEGSQTDHPSHTAQAVCVALETQVKRSLEA